MTGRFLLVSVVALSSCSAYGQQPASAPRQGGNSAPLHAVEHPWPHIGSPPSPEASAARVNEWQVEVAPLRKALANIEEGWTGEAIENPEDLRFKVGRYEDAVRTLTDAGGYGNLVLADTLRRLSFALLARYLVTHPGEHAVVAAEPVRGVREVRDPTEVSLHGVPRPARLDPVQVGCELTHLGVLLVQAFEVLAIPL